MITFYMEVQCFETRDKVKLKSWQVARVSADQLRTNDIIAHVLDRFFMTTGVILQLFNLDLMQNFDTLLFLLWHTHKK